MDEDSKAGEKPDVFLKTLGENLKVKEGVDADLAAILTTHLLKADLTQTAVAQAKEAIVKLAVDRANSSKVEVIND